MKTIPEFFYSLICRRRGHDVFTVSMHDASGRTVDVLEGCARGCGWRQVLVTEDQLDEP